MRIPSLRVAAQAALAKLCLLFVLIASSALAACGGGGAEPVAAGPADAVELDADAMAPQSASLRDEPATTAATSEVWGNYSLMDRAVTGVIWDNAGPASQYQWDVVSANESHIHWGTPHSWPVPNRERFIHSGSWVLLDGWWGNGTYYTQRVTHERLCDVTCNTCITLSGGVQHYAKWNVPTRPYCLQAEGAITEASSGKVVNFRHVQVYWPSEPCTNSSFPSATCIKQHETWWDDNQSSFQKRLDRTVYLAKGLGVAFRIEQTFPLAWYAELREAPSAVPDTARLNVAMADVPL
jgi:hypothetical protein